jgi:hypothetical protein
MRIVVERLRLMTVRKSPSMQIGRKPRDMPTIASQRILRAIVDERRRALSRSLHAGEHHRPADAPSLGTQMERLRKQTDRLRAQAIVLNAKLAGREEPALQAMREQIVETTARVDHAVNKIIRSAE